MVSRSLESPNRVPQPYRFFPRYNTLITLGDIMINGNVIINKLHMCSYNILSVSIETNLTLPIKKKKVFLFIIF